MRLEYNLNTGHPIKVEDEYKVFEHGTVTAGGRSPQEIWELMSVLPLSDLLEDYVIVDFVHLGTITARGKYRITLLKDPVHD